MAEIKSIRFDDGRVPYAINGDRDRLIRLLRLLLRLTGLTATAYLLHTAKKFRRTLKHGKKGKTA